MTFSQLKKLVSQGEGQFLEFKNRVPEPAKFARELVAFANTQGGILLIGVDDDGTILGVKDAIEEEYSIDQTLKHHCSEALDIEIKQVQISRSRSVVALHIRESPTKPIYVLEDSGRKTATIRVEDKAVDSSREMRRILKHQQSTNDVSFIFGEKEEVLMRYLEKNDQITVDEFARLCKLPRKLASHTLVLLTKAEVLTILPRDRGGDVFMLSNALD